MQTALHQRLASANARIGAYNGAETVLAFSDPARELHALNSACGLFDLNWRAKIVATGKDRVRWLNGMLTNSVRDLPLNREVHEVAVRRFVVQTDGDNRGRRREPRVQRIVAVWEG